ncbi:glycoside hydrolase family 79 protein [Penicillium hispanicum]|uniref:glycoside hydrolase family 79 protein n=1 Tax=Penicillium hispanicum TaxID=1080232 RepID=UPI0025400EEF|nr:glycoside hydrolase family 79 protein [Penicillium hispanicum]KAJ5587237.1 glycoside hydrolase family 79 protein [Penicillium hispanicum]
MAAIILFGLATLVSRSASQYTLTPEVNATPGASKRIDQSFPSFAIQVSSFPAFTGNASHPNIFSRNLIQSIEERTGAPLVVRVGGTNGDYSNYNPQQTTAVEPPMQGDGIGQKYVLGPVFYEGFRNWPNTQWVYDIPFAKENHTDSLYQAQHAISNIGETYLSGLEIGNEVDLYVQQGSRPAGYGPANYSVDFLQYADFLTQALSLPEKPLFQVLTLASDAAAPWSAEAAFEAGITKDNNVKSVSLHHYESTNTSTTLQDTLMNHAFMKAGVDDSFSSDFAYMQRNYPDVAIVLGEVGRFSDTQSSIDDSEGIFGSALWTADYLLYTMSLNVTRVNMQLSKAFGYVAWHPVAYEDLEPEVRAPYYGHLFASEFIGGSDSFRVSEISLDDDLVAGYAGYENDLLKRVALINYNVWTEGNGSRPNSTFTLKLPDDVKSVTIETLTSPGGATANHTFYWAGQTWTFDSNGLGENVPQIDANTTLSVQGGSVQVEVGASEAVLVQLV